MVEDDQHGAVKQVERLPTDFHQVHHTMIGDWGLALKRLPIPENSDYRLTIADTEARDLFDLARFNANRQSGNGYWGNSFLSGVMIPYL